MKKFTYLLFILPTFFLLFFFDCTNLFSLDITPPRIEISLRPNSEKTITLSLGNDSNSVLEINSTIGKYRFLLSQNTIMEKNKTPFDVIQNCETWITPELSNFAINPGEIKTISFKVKVPANVSGEYAASILLDLNTPVKPEEILDNDTLEHIKDTKMIDLDLSVIYRRPIAVYIFIEGTTKTAGNISEVSISDMLTEKVLNENFSNKNNRIKFSIDFTNTGSKHIRLKGGIVILNSQTGELVTTLSTGLSLPIFPSFREIIPVYWEVAPEYCATPTKPASYTAVITLELGDDVILQSEKEFSVNQKGFLIQ